MKPQRATYAEAMAAGRDAANRRMRKAGRSKWDRADWNEAVRVFERLYGKKANPGMFGSEAVAAARRVTRSRLIKEKSTGERGRIIGAGPQGWLKVKWDSRDKPTLIKRSEVRLARGIRSKNPIEIQRCTSCGQVFGQTTVCPMCRAGIGIRRNPQLKKIDFGYYQISGKLAGQLARQSALGRLPRFGYETDVTYKGQRYVLTRTIHNGKQVWALRGPHNPKRNGITEAAAGLQALEYIGSKAKKASLGPKPKFNPRAKGSRDALGVWHTENPSGTPAQNAAHMLELETIHYRQSGHGRQFLEDRFNKAFYEYQTASVPDRKRLRKALAAARKLLKAQKNPSVTTLSEKFQGEADGSVDQLHAADGAPTNLARAGKLVFLKVLCEKRPRTFRIPGAMVAIAPNEKLWIVGRPPLFETKARRGEGLDVGEVTHICYETAKAHIGNGRTYEYVHEFGEDGGRRPHLVIDAEGMPILRGGDYKIRAEGIVD